ncbi:hypothetical protein Ahia01_000543400 [Argonauta hians]
MVAPMAGWVRDGHTGAGVGVTAAGSCPKMYTASDDRDVTERHFVGGGGGVSVNGDVGSSSSGGDGGFDTSAVAATTTTIIGPDVTTATTAMTSQSLYPLPLSDPGVVVGGSVLPSTSGCDFNNVPPCSDQLTSKLYECYFPSELCGRLIGRQGKTITHIKKSSGAYVTLQPSPYTPNHQILTINGSDDQIESALQCISEKFPSSIYDNVDLTPIRDTNTLTSALPVVMPELIQLRLPSEEGVPVDVVVTSVVDASHVFLQLPTHPTYTALSRLDKFMNRCYSQPGLVPHLPQPLAVGIICVAPAHDSWYRALIVSVSEQDDQCEIKFLDYGGYTQISWKDLRQIRSDFMTLPFQAIEVYLANIAPMPDESYFSAAALDTLHHLTTHGVTQAQAVSDSPDGIPFVHMYQITGNKVVFVNRELANQNVVQWIESL